MTILRLRKYPDRCLLKRSRPIDIITSDETKLLEDMAETMHANNGIGLAAPQVGVNKRIAIVDAGDGLVKLINPDIISRDGQDTCEEGCLSVNSVSVRVTRPKKIRVRAVDENGEKIDREYTGLTAKAIQQEIDHLNGRLILDYLPFYKKALVKLWLKLKKER